MTTNRHKAIAMERMAARALEQRSDAIELLKSGLGYGTGTSTISEIEVMEREAAEVAKLSIPQQAALAKMTDSWQSAYESQTSLSTLRSLASKGFLVFRHQAGAMAFPRTGIEYRLAPRRA